MVLVTGLEPVRCFHRGILSPLRLPIPPHQRTTDMIINFEHKVNSYFKFILKKIPVLIYEFTTFCGFPLR